MNPSVVSTTPGAVEQHETGPLGRRSGRRPNVVLINCDDLGWGDLGCYGSTRNHTPAIDKLAAGGIRLDDFYVGSPVCSPSRGALLTGCYPQRIGFGSFDGLPVLFPGQGIGLHPNEVTIATMLRNAGYRTQMVGKWHCGDQPGFLPTDHGFDHWLGLPYSNDMGRQADVPPIFPNGVPPLPLMLDGDVLEQQPDQASLTERYVSEAVRFIRSSSDRPFFLYFAHMYVHVPIYVQERFARESQNGRYGAAVAAIDWVSAVLVHELTTLGLLQDTVVIFTSDNGSLGDVTPPWGGDGSPLGGSNGPFAGAKATTWEGGQRVPCIISWPGVIEPGSVSKELTTAMDLLPTIASWCNATVPADRSIDGRDLVPMLTNATGTSPHDAFFYYWMDNLEAVRSGRWKLHFAKRKEAFHALFDLHDDPGETADVAALHPDVVAAIEVIAERARADLGDQRTGRTGAGRRPAGTVATPRPLTTYDPSHPYCVAEYDLSDRG